MRPHLKWATTHEAGVHDFVLRHEAVPPKGPFLGLMEGVNSQILFLMKGPLLASFRPKADADRNCVSLPSSSIKQVPSAIFHGAIRKINV